MTDQLTSKNTASAEDKASLDAGRSMPVPPCVIGTCVDVDAARSVMMDGVVTDTVC